MVLAASALASSTRMTRSGFFAKVEGAYAAGDFANLPVPAPVAFLAPEELCEQCEGRGCLPKRGRKGQWKLCPSCTGMNGRHAGWDFKRYARSANGTPSYFRDTPVTEGAVREYWGPCRDCATDPISPCQGGENARVPWVIECHTCDDTGWQMHRTTHVDAADDWTDALL
ncbi:hypothetical protein [Nocardiopsis aegyptia]|uniref:Uncharacterized protein n=1 Tax=Nocardiopsis aegyptia TaxID=220378 RepID=A0A7Z0ELX8_9ACTN|nr:hypothetical protein [Nocardiopsis aegyptia]NYJ34484.1 hypothetical protein [Nocardiopsis aegyptia]